MEVPDLENPTSRSSSQKSSRRSGSRRSQKSAGQQSSPTVFPEKKGKSKSSRQKHLVFDNKDSKKAKNNEQKNDVVDEKSNFSGYEIYSGKLFFDKKNRITGDQISANGKADTTDVRLTSKALIWGSSLLSLEDVISVSYSSGVQHFIVHAYPSKKYLFGKTQRVRKDLRFIAPTVEEAISWLAGFHMEVVKTTHAGHAKSLASTFDFSAFPDGIVCVGGDGIVNEVFNGLLSRSDRAEAVSIPVGIIPAGSDNSLVWTVLGVKDPISASLLIVKGGFTALDILSVEWIQSGLIHFGTTVSYYGFVSDVLELSEKYQKKFGPLRYFVAGILKFFCLPSYFYELEYLPSLKEMTGHGKGIGQDNVVSDVYTNVVCSRSKREGIPRASSLSSIDSIMTPSRVAQQQALNLQSMFVVLIQKQNAFLWAEATLFQNQKKFYTLNHTIHHSGQEPGPKQELREIQLVSVIAPKANHDDNTLDLLLVGGKGRWKLLKFFILLQFGRHLSLPYVEYVKVKSVKLKPGANTHNGCGIDGELCRVKGHVLCSLLQEQCMLIGRQSRQST
uniref:DAGKc domain-containing protein n=1 Tax=Oryza punctata TaxID=4537 RepID=A0A0E0KTD0_ORYPU